MGTQRQGPEAVHSDKACTGYSIQAHSKTWATSDKLHKSVTPCRQSVDRLTEAAEVLLDHGHTDIYSWNRSQMQKHLARLDATAQQPPPKRSKTEVGLQLLSQ